MRIVTTKTEKTVADLVSRVFAFTGTPAPAVRQAAEAALLAANPHLSAAATLPPGVPVVVPNVPGTAQVDDDHPVAPPLVLIGDLRRTLARMATALNAAAAREADGARESLELVKSREVKALAKKSPELADRLPRFTDAATARLKDAETTAALQKDAVAQALRDLGALARSLG